MNAAQPARPRGDSRSELVADTALALLAERGMRGLTHRAVDEAAGLPPGSTSNLARTRAALLEAAVRRLVEREAELLDPRGLPCPAPRPDGAARSSGPTRPSGSSGAPGPGGPGGPDGPRTPDGPRALEAPRTPDGPRAPNRPDALAGPDALADALARVLHRTLTTRPELLLARYELALEATRRPELREHYDAAGRGFREPLAELMAAAGSAAPRRHALSLLAWCEGIMFTCAAGADHAMVPAQEELRSGLAELLRGMLGR